MNRALLSPVSALIAHVEPLVDNSRILVVGNATNSTAEHLLSRGARLVQVFDPDAKRVAQAAAQNGERRVTFSQLTPNSLRDGSFDIAMIEDIELSDDIDALLLGIKRSLSQRGLAVICARNDSACSGLLGVSRGTIDYGTFEAAVSSRFESITMLGQSPFLGYSVVQFELSGPPEPTLDNAYLAGEADEPDFYIALCCARDVQLSLEDMSIVQLPAHRLLKDSATGHHEKELRTARRVAGLESELELLRRRGAFEETNKLTAELEQRDVWIRQLEARAESADARADDAQAELDELEQELEDTHRALLSAREDADRAVADRNHALDEVKQVKGELDRLKLALIQAEAEAREGTHHSAGREALEEEINTLDDENVRLKSALDEQKKKVDRLEKRLVSQDDELDELHQQLDETEELLRAARTNVSQLEKKLAETEAFLQDAEDELEELASKATAPSNQESQQSANDLRKLEDQLIERGRHIGQLESQMRKLEAYARTLKVEREQPPSAPSTDLQDELDMLARRLAESEADLIAAQWTILQLQQSSPRNNQLS